MRLVYVRQGWVRLARLVKVSLGWVRFSEVSLGMHFEGDGALIN